MNRLLKIFLSVCAFFIVLIIAAMIILPLLITPNDFKPEIQAAVKKATDRELIIEGDLQLSVFPWLGISTGKIMLSNASGFLPEHFAKIEESNIKVKLLPLLAKEIEVSRIVLKGLVLNLAKNKQGESNWDDLSKAENATSASSPDKNADEANATSPLAALAVGGISIENANISWNDQQQNQHIEITGFNFNSGKLAFDQAIDVALSLTVTDKTSAITESISFSTDLVINKALDNFKLSAVNLKSITTGSDIPGEALEVNLLADVAIDLSQQIASISGLKLSMGELLVSAEIKGTHIKDNPAFSGAIKIAEFNLIKLMKDMSMPLSARQDPKALNKISASFMLQVTQNSANIDNVLIKLDESTVEGASQIINFTSPAIKFNFNLDSIDADRYLAVEVASSSKQVVATPATAAATSAGLFPIETLRKLNANGELSIGKLVFNQLKMQGLKLKLNAKNGVLKTQQDIKLLYQGSYTGKTSINVQKKQPRITLNEQLSKVDIAPLLQDLQGYSRLTGIVNANAVLQGYGNSTPAIKSSLQGRLAFNFNNGVIKGFNLQKIIDNAKSLIKGSPLPTDNKNDQTVFSIIKGTAQVNKGLVKNEDLYMEASKLRINGNGTANLASSRLNYKINAKLLKTIGSATEAEKVKGMPVVINIGGTFAKPSYQLDIAAMLLKQNKKKIIKKVDTLLKKLDDKIAPGVGDLLKSFL